MNNSYQTVIIGAGIGGLMAGHYLKEAIILDKKEEVGKPVRSGEGISRKALERLGIKSDKKWISSKIDNVQRITPNGKIFGRFEKNRGYILNKSLFEKFLANQSKAEIQLNTEVVDLKKEDNFWEVKTKNGKIFKSKFLIGADGSNSIVRQKFFKEKMKILPAIQYLVKLEKEIEEGVVKIYLDNEKFPQGYAWIFPKSNDTANIGLGGEGNLSKKFQEFLREIVKRNYGDFKLLENRSGIVPFGGAQLEIAKDNILLIGDAAGLADPIFLGGMSQSMMSGKIAAECILKDKIDLYEEKIKATPFANPELIEAREIFYSLDNQILNELGELLEGKGTSYLKTFPGITNFLKKPRLRKKFFKIAKFFLIWWQNRDYLW